LTLGTEYTLLEQEPDVSDTYKDNFKEYSSIIFKNVVYDTDTDNYVYTLEFRDTGYLTGIASKTDFKGSDWFTAIQLIKEEDGGIVDVLTPLSKQNINDKTYTGGVYYVDTDSQEEYNAVTEVKATGKAYILSGYNGLILDDVFTRKDLMEKFPYQWSDENKHYIKKEITIYLNAGATKTLTVSEITGADDTNDYSVIGVLKSYNSSKGVFLESSNPTGDVSEIELFSITITASSTDVQELPSTTTDADTTSTPETDSNQEETTTN
jgi:hypothetical protein